MRLLLIVLILLLPIVAVGQNRTGPGGETGPLYESGGPGGGTDDQTAAEVPYTTSITGWAAANVQSAIDGILEWIGPENICQTELIKGGRFNAATGRYGWTCGDYNWHGWQSVAQGRTDQTNASYVVTCTGDGTGTPNVQASTCLHDETRYVGYGLHRIALAAQYTADGGTVYLSDRIYVDTGAGLHSDGVTRSQWPLPYLPDWEALPNFSDLGYYTQLRTIQINRGVRLRGASVPHAVETSPDDTAVNSNRPRITGTWIVDDRGNASLSCGASGCALDGPSTSVLPIDQYRIMVGNNRSTAWCITTSGIDPTCILEQNIYNQDLPDINVYAAAFPTLDYITSEFGAICVPDADYLVANPGTTPSDGGGTCSGNRKIKCWDTSGVSDGRDSGGCVFDLDNDGDYSSGDPGNLDYGICQSPYDALVQDYVTDSKDFQLAINLTSCVDGADAFADCGSPLGNDLYIADFRSAPGSAISSGSCGVGGFAGQGTWVQTGVAKATTNDFAPPFTVPTFFTPASGQTNAIYPIRRGSMNGKDAGFERIGRMPGSWYGRNATTAVGRCLSAGDTDSADDEVYCDSDTLAGFGASYNNRIGPENLFYNVSQAPSNKSGVVETLPSGGPNSFTGNTIFQVNRGTAVDWGWGSFDHNYIEGVGTGSDKYGFMLCFGGYCDVHDNVIKNSALSYGYLAQVASARFRIFNNTYYNTNVAETLYYVWGGKSVSVEDEFYAGLYGGPVGIISPGFDNDQRPTAVFKGLRGYYRSGGVNAASTSGGSPAAMFVIQNQSVGQVRNDAFNTILFDDLYLKAGPNSPYDPCLVWFEDDTGETGSVPGAGTEVADNAALTREGAGRVTIMNSSIIGSANSRIACAGKYRFASTVMDATDSRNWAFEQWTPRLFNNTVNYEAVPDMLPTLSASFVDDADNLPKGTIVRVGDGATQQCSHTNGALTGSGSTLATCISDPGTSGSSTDGTWTPTASPVVGTSSIVINATTSITVTDATMQGQSYYLTNAGAKNVTLPACRAGLIAKFYDNSSDGGGVININPAGSEVIILDGTPGSAGASIDSPDTRGDFVTLECIDASTIVVTGRSGTWVPGS